MKKRYFAALLAAALVLPTAVFGGTAAPEAAENRIAERAAYAGIRGGARALKPDV